MLRWRRQVCRLNRKLKTSETKRPAAFAAGRLNFFKLTDDYFYCVIAFAVYFNFAVVLVTVDADNVENKRGYVGFRFENRVHLRL